MKETFTSLLLIIVTFLGLSKTFAQQEFVVTNDFDRVNGVNYKVVQHQAGAKKISVGEIIKFHIIAVVDTFVGDPFYSSKRQRSTLGNSYTQPDAKPAVAKVEDVNTKGQWTAILPFLSVGDSVLIQIDCSTIKEGLDEEKKKTTPTWMKAGNKIFINLKIVAVKSMEDYQSELKASQTKQQAEQAKIAEKQLPIDEQLIENYLALPEIQEYFRNNNIKPIKTNSGLYVIIQKEGYGSNIREGQKPSINYSGMFLDGKVFDSNTDPSFNHMEPFAFTVGKKMVIPGWEEGVVFMKKGTKATLLIPSTLAYGARATGTIPANSVLMFDMEIMDITE